MPACLELAVDGPIATINVVNRTMPPAFFEELGAVCDAVEADESVRVAVIRGAHPKALSYGLDLPAAFGKWGNLFRGGELARGRTRLHRLIKQLQAPFNKLAALRVPTIVAIHGWCIGGGVDLISACDIRMASADAKFSVRETKIAIVADLGGLQRLPPIIGQGATRELAFTGRDFDAAYAREIGLVNAVHEDHAALAAAALALAQEIAANPPLTVQGVKAVLNQGIDREIGRGLDYVAAWNSAFLPAEDLGEAVSAFTAKRAPEFKGR